MRLGASGASTFDWPASARHCRLAWLRGLFLASGSLSLSGSSVHLEFVVEPLEAPVLAARVAEIGFPASHRVRRGRGVVTWKRGDTVVRFLRAAGAGPALLDLEARAVARALRAELTRLSNADTANVARSVAASARQIEAIRRLMAADRLTGEREAVRAVAVARLEAPDATISDLAATCGCTRASAQRALERLVRLSEPDARVGPARTTDPSGPGTDFPSRTTPFGPVRRTPPPA